MNWLAHLALSESQPEFRVGNVLADILPIGALRELPASFQAGVARHREIDSFTDGHPIYRRSVARLEPPFRRFGGVIMDVFYDHLLTASWGRFSALPLNDFVTQFHADVEACRAQIPDGAYSIFERMRHGQWLMAYRDIEGVRITLDRIAIRMRRPFDLGAVLPDLQFHYQALCRDFDEFYPLIDAHFGRPAAANHPLS